MSPSRPRRTVQATELELTIEKPVAGGRMLARHEGKVILVTGALPGERVRVAVDRSTRDVSFASVRDVLDASPDRRAVMGDPSCGGHVYAHVRYERQLQLKSEVVDDALRRLAGRTWDPRVEVAPSPQHGYRIRARLHVGGGRAGFLREGTRRLCDPATTKQLTTRTLARVEQLRRSLGEISPDTISAIDLAENISGDECAMHLTVSTAWTDARLRSMFGRMEDVLGVSAGTIDETGESAVAGTPVVSDSFASLVPGSSREGTLRRRPASFFQANRYLLPALVTRVVDAVSDGPVLDLYAGVGLFAAALAAAGRRDVTAVEGDRVAAEDLARNAVELAGEVTAVRASVEAYLASAPHPAPRTVIVDPPRTGLSAGALAGIAPLQMSRLVYVSCDVATFARDLGRLIAAGYRLASLHGFDLFPNTAHVELVAVLDHSGV